MTAKIPLRISSEGIEFLKRFRNNRRKVGIDDKDKAYWELIEIIERYFKLNNDSYLELVKTK